MSRKVRVVLNNEAFVDFPVPDNFGKKEWEDFIKEAMRTGGILFDEACFIPYGQVQTIFLFKDDTPPIAVGKGVTLQ